MEARHVGVVEHHHIRGIATNREWPLAELDRRQLTRVRRVAGQIAGRRQAGPFPGEQQQLLIPDPDPVTDGEAAAARP